MQLIHQVGSREEQFANHSLDEKNSVRARRRLPPSHPYQHRSQLEREWLYSPLRPWKACEPYQNGMGPARNAATYYLQTRCRPAYTSGHHNSRCDIPAHVACAKPCSVQTSPICKTLSEEVISANNALFPCFRCRLISLGCWCAAQKSLLSVQPEESTCRAPEPFLRTVLQYYHKRRDGQNKDPHGQKGMVCAKIPYLENDVLECTNGGLGCKFRWGTDDLR